MKIMFDIVWLDHVFLMLNMCPLETSTCPPQNHRKAQELAATEPDEEARELDQMSHQKRPGWLVHMEAYTSEFVEGYDSYIYMIVHMIEGYDSYSYFWLW